MLPPKRKQICPKVGHLVKWPAEYKPGNSDFVDPVVESWDVGLVVHTEGIRLHILSSGGTIVKGVRRDSVEIIE